MKTLLLIFLTLFSILSFGQSTISTNFTNNNGSAIITFNFQNTNTTDVVITQVASATGTTGANNATLWYKPTNVGELTQNISIHPNPTKGVLTIQWLGAEQASVKVFDIQGKMVLSTQMVENMMNIS
jgi:anionic cell wall polymer biosynthesis LytR-Cps2A-Psr (LCP) family protein